MYTVYKAVEYNEKNGELISLCTRNPQWEVAYEFGWLIKPLKEESNLFVFDKVENCIPFLSGLRMRGLVHVLECVSLDEPVSMQGVEFLASIYSEWEEFWAGYRKRGYFVRVPRWAPPLGNTQMVLPPGTLTVPSLIPVRTVGMYANSTYMEFKPRGMK